jgi:hypothetical protein
MKVTIVLLLIIFLGNYPFYDADMGRADHSILRVERASK